MEISPESFLEDEEEKSIKCKFKSSDLFLFLLILIYFWNFFVYYFFVFPGLYYESRVAYSVTITVLLCFSIFYAILTKIDNISSLLQFQKYPLEQLKYCSYCNCRVPIKAYHCQECNKCRIFYDHHNKLLNICISKANYKHYMKYVLTFFFADFLIICASFNTIYNFTKSKDDVISSYKQMRSISLNVVTFFVLLLVCIIIFIFPFLAYYLIQAIRIILSQKFETTSLLLKYYKKPPFYYYEFSEVCNSCCPCFSCCRRHPRFRGSFSD